MGRFVEGEDRRQSFLLPASLDDYVTEDNPVRVVEAFIDELDLGTLGFEGVQPAVTGLPPLDDAEDLPLRLPQPASVEPPP
jgi:transposase